MKKGIWILLGMMLVGVGICLGSLVFAPRGAETPTATEGVISPPEPTPTRAPAPTSTRAVGGTASEDVAYRTCWTAQVMGPWDILIDSLGALSKALIEGDFGTSKVWVSLVESDLQTAKAAILACPTPKHRLLVSSREKSLRGVDLMALYCRYMEEGLSTLDADLISKGLDPLLEANGLLQEATSDIERYNVEVLGD